MSREIKFRYTFKRKGDGHLFTEIVPLDCVEGRGDTPFILQPWKEAWELIGRDLFAGLHDKNGKEIYEGDIVKADNLVCLVEWKGVEWVATWKDKRDKYPISPQLGFRSHEVIGNIYETPEILEN